MTQKTLVNFILLLLLLFISLYMMLVRSYHQTYYRPDNLCIVIAGKIDRSQLFSTLNTIDQNIINHNQQTSLSSGIPIQLDVYQQQQQRPWSSCLSSIPDLVQNVTETVLFPDLDETIGAISISWLGPLGNVGGTSKQKKW